MTSVGKGAMFSNALNSWLFPPCCRLRREACPRVGGFGLERIMRESRTRKGLLTPGVCKLKGHAIITDIIYIMVPPFYC